MTIIMMFCCFTYANNVTYDAHNRKSFRHDAAERLSGYTPVTSWATFGMG